MLKQSFQLFVLFLLSINFIFITACEAGSSGIVSYVYDGDTVKINNKKVRLLGIDTPEMPWPQKNRKGQCFAQEAKDFLTKQVLNKQVKLVFDPLADKQDRFGRQLAYIYLGKRNLNAQIIQEGYGFAYVKFPYSKRERFKQYQAKAKRKQRGVWKECRIQCKHGRCRSPEL